MWSFVWFPPVHMGFHRVFRCPPTSLKHCNRLVLETAPWCPLKGVFLPCVTGCTSIMWLLTMNEFWNFVCVYTSKQLYPIFWKWNCIRLQESLKGNLCYSYDNTIQLTLNKPMTSRDSLQDGRRQIQKARNSYPKTQVKKSCAACLIYTPVPSQQLERDGFWTEGFT